MAEEKLRPMPVAIEHKPRPRRPAVPHSPQHFQAAQLVEPITGINERSSAGNAVDCAAPLDSGGEVCVQLLQALGATSPPSSGGAANYNPK